MITQLSGSTLGRYNLREKVGSGATACVYRGIDPDLNREVALKVLPSSAMEDGSSIDRFRQEAKAVASLSHPNILQVFDFGADKGFTYIVTPFIPGGTMSKKMRDRHSLAEAIVLTAPIADALDYSHQSGIIHRDLKPSNIYMQTATLPILGDFGFARLLSSDQQLTRAGLIFGTPHYMAPEQTLGQPVDHRSDLYSLGVILYQLLLGRVPFDNKSTMATLMAHVHQPVPLPSEAETGVKLPPHIENFLLRALAKDPNDRYQSAAEMVNGLSPSRVKRLSSPSSFKLERSRPMPPKPASSIGNSVSPGPKPFEHVPTAIHANGNLPISSTKSSIKVALVEDESVLLEGLDLLLTIDTKIEVVGRAQSAEDAMALLGTTACDIVVMDINLPGMSGIEATRQIKSQRPDIKVMILSGHGKMHFHDAVNAGADGYMMKSSKGDRLRQAIHDVYAGGMVVDPFLNKQLYQRLAQPNSDPNMHRISNPQLAYK